MAEDDRDRGAWIGELLDAAADAYEPDGERLRELVAERVAQDADGRRPARRLGHRGVGRGPRALLDRAASTGAAIAAVAAAVAIAVAVTATLAVTSSSPATGGANGGPGRTGAAIVPPDPGADPGRDSASASPSANTKSAAAGPGAPDAYTVSARIDQSSTDNPVWTQLDVSVVATKPIGTALDITIRVADCPGLDQPASYTTAPSGSFAKSIVPGTDGATEFEFHLAAGQNPGTTEFAAQFGHAATGCNPAEDGYRVTGPGGAATASGSY